MILRDASTKELVARRDELRAQLFAIDGEIARRFREACQQQQRERDTWARLNPRPMLETSTQR